MKNELSESEKLNYVWNADNLFEVIVNYLALERCGQGFDFGSYIIPKGTILYRIRKYEPDKDFSDKKEWGPSPMRRENRANKEGEEALYLNVMSDMCILETHIEDGEPYMLGRYECIEDIEVGGYITWNDNKMRWLGVLANAFLIAPSRNEGNTKLFQVLDNYFGKIELNDMKMDSLNDDLILPFKFAVMNQGKELYKITNLLCDVIRKRYPMGIKYSSSFCPLETIDIESNCYNVVLYSEGIKKIRFIECEKLENKKKDFTSANIVRTMLESAKK